MRAARAMASAAAVAAACTLPAHGQAKDGPAAPAQRAPAGPSTVIPPPWVPDAGAQPTPGGAGRTGAMPPPYLPNASQYLVQPGQSWQHIVPELKPGDEVIFPAGFHLPMVLDGLKGTRERPIILRSRDRVPAAVACEVDGWVFRRPEHVIVENILFLNPRGAAIAIDGRDQAAGPGMPAQPWKAEFTVRSCSVSGSRKDAGQDAVRVVACSDVRVDQVRVDGWTDAAVEIDSSRRVLVRALMMVPSPQLRQEFGVKVLGPSGELSVTGCAFNKAVRTGVSVGSPCPGGDAALAPPVDRMRVDRCVFENPGTALQAVNVRDLVLSRATIVNPTDAIYAIPEDAGTVEQVLVEKCLAYWTPGVLQRFSPHPGRLKQTAVTLADNLWFSVELPTAWEVLGAPFGYMSVPQVTAFDPGIEATSLRPRNAEAMRYGAHSLGVPAGSRPAENPVQGQEPPPVRKPGENGPG